MMYIVINTNIILQIVDDILRITINCIELYSIILNDDAVQNCTRWITRFR